MLDDHILKAQTMHSSAYIKPFEEEMKTWEDKLISMQVNILFFTTINKVISELDVKLLCIWFNFIEISCRSRSRTILLSLVTKNTFICGVYVNLNLLIFIKIFICAFFIGIFLFFEMH